MSILKDFKQKPLEIVASTVLVAGGIITGYSSKNPWWIAVGALASALGGALFSSATLGINIHERAAKYLEPELQSMARHLADTAAKLNRTIQEYNNDDAEAEITIDRISQLISSLYTSLSDISIIVGSITNYEMVVDTVRGCEDMAEKLGEIITRSEKIPDEELTELSKLKTQLEVARKQIDLTRKTLGDMPGARKEEKVPCPTCNTEHSVLLGISRYDVCTKICDHCGGRFNIHRGVAGVCFTRPIKQTPSMYKKMDIVCPQCKVQFKIKFDTTKSVERRFCLQCCFSMDVSSSGEISNPKQETPVAADNIGFSGIRQILRCPKCNNNSVAFWTDKEITRGVCLTDMVILQSEYKQRTV